MTTTSPIGFSMDLSSQTSRVGTMTASTSSTMTTKSVTSIDMNDLKSFRGSILSPDQMRERFNILSELEEKLAEENKELSRSDEKELRCIVDLQNRAQREKLDGQAPFPIYRLTAPHYSVQYGRSKKGFYEDIERQIKELPQTAVQILQAIQPTQQDSWFHSAIVEHAQDVLSSGFMSALRATLVANMCVLRASMLLVGEPRLYREALTLYSNSNNLYNTQTSYNRQVELELITSAEDSYYAITSLHRQILEICGSDFGDNPTDLEAAAQKFRVDETQASLEANTAIEIHCNLFLAEIAQLETQAQTCITNISGRHSQVTDALAEVKSILEQQERLHNKQREIQADFEKFQQTRSMELNSRREVVHSSTQVFRTGMWWWRRAIFVTTHRSEIVESDFGSHDAHTRYLQALGEGDALAKRLEQARDNLTTSMVASGLMQYGKDQKSLETAAGALSTAMMCIGELKIALLQRRNQATDQKCTCEALLRGPRDDSLKTVTAVLNFLEMSIERTIRKQALWLGSSRQTFTLQKCQELEQRVRIQVINALSNSASDPSAIASAARELEYRFPAGIGRKEGDRSVEAQLPSYPEMLQHLAPKMLTLAESSGTNESKRER